MQLCFSRFTLIALREVTQRFVVHFLLYGFGSCLSSLLQVVVILTDTFYSILLAEVKPRTFCTVHQTCFTTTESGYKIYHHHHHHPKDTQTTEDQISSEPLPETSYISSLDTVKTLRIISGLLAFHNMNVFPSSQQIIVP
jgi:hypothetical protein